MYFMDIAVDNLKNIKSEKESYHQLRFRKDFKNKSHETGAFFLSKIYSFYQATQSHNHLKVYRI